MLNGSVIKVFLNCSFVVSLNGYGVFDDLGFLEYLMDVLDLRISGFGEVDLEFINKYCRLKYLVIGGNNCRIEQIINYDLIESLFIFEKIKDIELIGRMKFLKKLMILKMILKNFDFLKDLIVLKEFYFVLGGIKNLEVLLVIGRIELLSFVVVK